MNNAISGTIPAASGLRIEEPKKAKISMVKMNILALNNEKIMPKETAMPEVKVEAPVQAQPVVETKLEPTVVASAPKEDVGLKYKNIKSNFGLTVYDCENITATQNGGRKLKVNPIVVSETKKLEKAFDMMIPEVKAVVPEVKVAPAPVQVEVKPEVKEEVKVEVKEEIKPSITPEPLTRLSRLGEETKEVEVNVAPVQQVVETKVETKEEVKPENSYSERVVLDNGNGKRLDGYLGRNSENVEADDKIAELLRQVENAKKQRDAKLDRNQKAEASYEALKAAQIEKLTKELLDVNSEIETIDNDYDGIMSKTESLDGVIAQIRETMDEENSRTR